MRVREFLHEIAMSLEVDIFAGAINRNPVHMLIGIPPNISMGRAVQCLKGNSLNKFLSEFPQAEITVLGAAFVG